MLGTLGDRPLAAGPDGRVPERPQDAQDQACLHRPVQHLQARERDAPPADLLAERTCQKGRIDEKDRGRHQLGQRINRRERRPYAGDRDGAQRFDRREADEREQVPGEAHAPLHNAPQQPDDAVPALGDGRDDEGAHGGARERADPDQDQEARRAMERQQPASVPREHEQRPHQPRSGIGDDEIRDQRITADQATHERGPFAREPLRQDGAITCRRTGGERNASASRPIAIDERKLG